MLFKKSKKQTVGSNFPKPAKYPSKLILAMDIEDRRARPRDLSIAYSQDDYLIALKDGIQAIRNAIPYLPGNDLQKAKVACDILIKYRTELLMKVLTSQFSHEIIASAEEYAVQLLSI